MTPFAMNRRAFLGQYAGAIGSLALAHLLEQEQSQARAGEMARQRPRARSVICLFQHGGPSQMDLFDPKPALSRYHGKPYPGQLEIHFDKQAGNLLESPFRFRPNGASGTVLSELLPYTAGVVDELTLIRSMFDRLGRSRDGAAADPHREDPGRSADVGLVGGLWPGHREPQPAGLRGPERSRRAAGRRRPQLVERLAAGDLPGDTVPPGRCAGPPPQDADRRDARRPRRPARVPRRAEPHPPGTPPGPHRARGTDRELRGRRGDADGRARALDLASESEATRRMYGLDDPITREYGTRCLLARRLVERGVRFVQLFLSSQPWDTHDKNARTLKTLCARTDKPSAALVRDLRQRGLLDETIVLWTGEFGRLPVSQGKDGRDHNRHGFSLWLAGGGFKPGYTHGATDEFGYKAVDKVVTVYDLQATLLHALGLDHRKLAYPHEGRLDTLTDAEVTKARVVPELLV